MLYVFFNESEQQFPFIFYPSIWKNFCMAEFISVSFSLHRSICHFQVLHVCFLGLARGSKASTSSTSPSTRWVRSVRADRRTTTSTCWAAARECSLGDQLMQPDFLLRRLGTEAIVTDAWLCSPCTKTFFSTSQVSDFPPSCRHIHLCFTIPPERVIKRQG